MHLLRFSLALVAGVALSGCPGSETNDVAVTADEYIDASIAFLDDCNLFGAVSEREPIFIGVLEAQSLVGLRASLRAQLESPSISFNAENAAACVAAMERAQCDEQGQAALGECDDVFVGALALGDSCAFNDECADDNTTCFGLSDSCGVCTKRVGIGDDCSAAACEDGTCRNDVCVAKLSEGASCTDADTCADGLACSDDVCRAIAVVQVGEACNGDTARCINSNSTNFCNIDGVCTARATTGDDCGSLSPCDATVSVCRSGTCVVDGAEGATCSSTSDCQVGLRCDGTCTPLFSASEAPICE
jgi:hypothetical protein